LFLKAVNASQLLEKMSFFLMFQNPHDILLPLHEAFSRQSLSGKLTIEQEIGTVDPVYLKDHGSITRLLMREPANQHIRSTGEADVPSPMAGRSAPNLVINKRVMLPFLIPCEGENFPLSSHQVSL